MSGTPILSRRVQVAVETEATTGAAETLVAADVTHRVGNASFVYNFDSEPQDLMQADLSELPDMIGNRPCEITYDTLLAGSGAVDTAAGWAQILIHGGFKETVTASTKVTYTPETPASTKTATVGMWRGAASGSSGRLFIAKGCRVASMSISLESGKKVKMSVTWRGAFSSDADASAFSGVTYDSTLPVKAMKLGMSIGSWTPFFKSMNININNTLAQIDDPGNASEASGISHFEITRREIVGDLQIIDVLKSDKDHLADVLAQTTAALALTAGDTTGNKVTLAAPALQMLVSSEGNAEDIMTRTIPFKLTRSSGDDEFTITTL